VKQKKAGRRRKHPQVPEPDIQKVDHDWKDLIKKKLLKKYP
jgi:hypothetical protein